MTQIIPESTGHQDIVGRRRRRRRRNFIFISPVITLRELTDSNLILAAAHTLLGGDLNDLIMMDHKS